MRLLLTTVAMACAACAVANAQEFKNGISFTSDDHLSMHEQFDPQHVQNLRSQPARVTVGTVQMANEFGSHDYHGKLTRDHGHWHKAVREGRFGWWREVGSVWYFYSEPVQDEPTYVSGVETENQAPPAQQSPATAQPSTQSGPPEDSHYSVFYRPGDLNGVRYQTLEECWQAIKKAGNVGVCVMK